MEELWQAVEHAIRILGRSDATDIERYGAKNRLEEAYKKARTAPVVRDEDEKKGEMKARARRTDPGTSHKAAFKLEALGKANSQRRMCFREVIRHPGRTYAEIATGLGWELVIAGKRLPELRDAGFIRNGPEKKCSIRGSICLTWVPVQGMEAYGDEPRAREA